MDETAFPYEIVLVDVVSGGDFVGEAASSDGTPAEVLFDKGTEVWKVWHVGEGRRAVGWDVFVDLGLELCVFIRVEGYR